MRVLIVKTSSMGDVLHTLPALTDAAQAIPGIRFDWVVEEGFAQIPSWHESVERVIPVAIRRWRKAWFSAPIKAERQAFREAVQAVKYDAIIDAQGLVKSAALVTRLAHGVKHGMDWQTAREPLASLFYNRRHHIAKQQHAVERTRELFAKSLGYAKPQTQGDYAIARHFLQHEASAAAPYLVFLHATTRDDKHWPENRWQELLDLLADSGVRIKLPWGAPHEEARAKRLAEEGAPNGTLTTAETQTAGKGRRGRVWKSPEGTSVSMSILLYPDLEPAKAPMLTIVMGLAVVQGVQKALGVDTKIKWPNDAVLNGKKLCGILTEMSAQIDYINYVVIGTGINVNQMEFPEEIAEIATSLAIEMGHPVNRAKVVAAVLEAFEEDYEKFLEAGDLSGLKEAYEAVLANKDQPVRVLDPKEPFEGVALGITPTGELRVQKEDGTITEVHSGEVSVRGLYSYV